MFSTSPESPPLFIVDPTVLSRQLHRNNNLCVSERHDPRTEVARRPIWAEVARIRPAPMRSLKLIGENSMPTNTSPGLGV